MHQNQKSSLQNRLNTWVTGSPEKVSSQSKLKWKPFLRLRLQQLEKNYYQDTWFCRSELLAPLASLTSSKVKFECLPTNQQAFDKIKKVIETEVLLTYPDFDKPFHIYTDASDHQLGAVIMQEKSLDPFIQESLIQPNKDTPPLT